LKKAKTIYSYPSDRHMIDELVLFFVERASIDLGETDE
jgi:hypothetical protein